MKQTAISLVIASALLAATPALAQQAAPNQAAQTRQAGSPSKLVLDNSTRILSTLESRRAAFTRDRAALSNFVSSEFNQMFDRDVMVEGVSFVQTFRNQFDTPLRQKSIPQVAAELKAGKLNASAN